MTFVFVLNMYAPGFNKFKGWQQQLFEIELKLFSKPLVIHV